MEEELGIIRRSKLCEHCLWKQSTFMMKNTLVVVIMCVICSLLMNGCWLVMSSS